MRWLLGKYQPRPEMAKFLHLSEFEPDSGNEADEYIGADGYPSSTAMVPSATRTGMGPAALLDGQLRRELEKLTNPAPVVVFWGADQLSQAAAAHGGEPDGSIAFERWTWRLPLGKIKPAWETADGGR